VATSDYLATASAFLVKIDGTESFRVKSNGYSGYNAFTMNVTTSAAKGNYALSSTIAVSLIGSTTTPVLITASSVTIVTNGRPVKMGFLSAGTDLSNGSNGIYNARVGIMHIYKDGSPLLTFAQEVSQLTTTMLLVLPISAYNGMDWDATAGTHTYDVRLDSGSIDFARFYAYEI
jgi:hypothetical protein